MTFSASDEDDFAYVDAWFYFRENGQPVYSFGIAPGLDDGEHDEGGEA